MMLVSRNIKINVGYPIMKNLLMSILLLANSSIFAMTPTYEEPEIVYCAIHLDESEREYLHYLIEENVKNLEHAGARDHAAQELIYLIEEGYPIDERNIAKLIKTLEHAGARDHAKVVLMKAIEYHCLITSEHLCSLIRTLEHAGARSNATEILLVAIEYRVPFGLTERILLSGLSKHAGARDSAAVVRKALHEREMKGK